MGVPRLVPYIEQQLKAGYDINTIRDFLIRNGYDSRSIDEAVNHIYKKPSEGILSLKTILGGSAAVIFIALIIFLTLGGEKTPEQLLDLETSTLINEIEQGDTLNFNIQLINMGTAKRYDISITHDLVSSTGTTITTKQETMALETRSAKTSQIAIPENAASGTYTVKTTAKYNGQEALSFFTITIKAKQETETIPSVPEKEEETIPSTTDTCPASCDDKDYCTEDICNKDTGYQCIHNKITPCCGNLICESGENNDNCPSDCKEETIIVQPEETETITISEMIEKAKDMAESNPDQAAGYCFQQERQNYKDSCYNAVSETTKDSSYCDLIESTTKKDSCYTTAALEGDFTVCEKITNKYLKQSCEALEDVS